MESQLADTLAQMNPEKVARWGIYVLDFGYRQTLKRYWWNPLVLISVLLVKAWVRHVLMQISEKRSGSLERTDRKIDHVRRLAEELNAEYTLKFFSEFQCSYDSYQEGYFDLASSGFRGLAVLPRRQAACFQIDAETHLSHMYAKAQELAFFSSQAKEGPLKDGSKQINPLHCSNVVENSGEE